MDRQAICNYCDHRFEMAYFYPGNVLKCPKCESKDVKIMKYEKLDTYKGAKEFQPDLDAYIKKNWEGD